MQAAPPPPYAAGVAVVLLAEARAYVAASGAGRCYRERAGRLEELAAGGHDLQPGDALVASSHAALPLGREFFGADRPAPPTAEFRNDTLDDALHAALGRAGAGFAAVAAARVR